MKKIFNILIKILDVNMFLLSFLFILSSVFNIWDYINIGTMFSSEIIELIAVWAISLILSGYFTPRLYRDILELRKPLAEWRLLRFLK